MFIGKRTTKDVSCVEFARFAIQHDALVLLVENSITPALIMEIILYQKQLHVQQRGVLHDLQYPQLSIMYGSK